MKLCLDSLTLNDIEPNELIHSAASAGFDFVSLWVQPPSIFPKALVRPSKVSTCEAALSATGIKVNALEVFDMSSLDAITAYRPALELGAKIGARSASAINLFNNDAAQVSDLFAHFAELASECGLLVTFEPLAYFATSTLAQAENIVRASGVDAGLVLDITHLIRAGGGAAEVRALTSGIICNVQLCDGPAEVAQEEQAVEASLNRLYPGEGVFPIDEILAECPDGIVWSIEAPSRIRAATQSAQAQASDAMAALRSTLASAHVDRSAD